MFNTLKFDTVDSKSFFNNISTTPSRSNSFDNTHNGTITAPNSSRSSYSHVHFRDDVDGGLDTPRSIGDGGRISLSPSQTHSPILHHLIKMRDLSPRKVVGQGTQGTVFKTEWKGTTVVYKKMHAISDTHRAQFTRELSVWQYVSIHIFKFKC